MKKIIFFVFVLIGTLFIFGTNAKAGEDNLNVNIKSITLMEKSDNAEVLSEPSAEGLGINSNVKFLLVGDFVTYKVTFENKDSADYKINLNSDNEYFTYSLDSNVVKANGETELLLTIKYSKIAPQSMFTNEQLNEQSVVSGTLIRNVESVVADDSVTVTAEKETSNPNTADTIGKVVIYVVLLGVTVSALVFVKSTKKRMLVLTVFAASLLCTRVSAEDSIELKINSKIFVQGGLVYNGEVVHKSSLEDKIKDLHNQLVNRCDRDDAGTLYDIGTLEQHFGDTNIVPIAESTAIFTISGYLTDDLDIGLSMTAAYVFNPDSGDTELQVYDYNYNSSVLDRIDYTKLIYNNELLDRKGLEKIIESDSLKIGNVLTNVGYGLDHPYIDYLCMKDLLNLSAVDPSQEI